MQKGFTLLELLIVIAILAILTTAVVMIMNPLEAIKRARDTQRIADLDNLKAAVILYIIEGNVDIKDDTCIKAGATFDPCQSNDGATPTKTDGTGWIPINFDGMAGGSPMSHLPIDPVNSTSTASLVYSYAADGTDFELNVGMESAYFNYSTGKNKVGAEDGGDSGPLYEVGTDLTIFECIIAGAASPDCADEGVNTTCTNGTCVAPGP